MGKTLRRTRLFASDRSQRGDTIVEVMISLIVISTILTGAFMVSHTSSQNIRASQEHAEALQLLQGQTELLRSAATKAGSKNDLGSTALSGSQCLDDSAAVVTGANCTKNTLYKLAVSYEGPSGSGTTNYKLQVTWDGIHGGTDQETLRYRVALQN